jgi:hypothetical protein
MDDDPDDLAAAFFAQQTAKEKAKATLPTDNWIRVIEAAAAKNTDGTAVENKAVGGHSLAPVTNDGDAVNPSSWLVTTMPPAPTCHAGDGDNGIIGIVLDSSENHCRLGTNPATEDATKDRNELTLAETVMRRRLKDFLVQKLEEEMKET